MGSQEAARAVSGGGSAGQQMMKSLSLLALVAGAMAQKPARIGADGKPLLNRPDIEECINVNGWFWAGAGNGRIPPTNVPHPESAWSRTGETGIPQPDNYEGIKEGPIEAENNIGITIEGLQEFHDEACLAVLNNKYGDGIKWHDVACHFRSVIVCEDSDQLINLIATQEGVDVRDEADEGTNAIDVDSLPKLPELSSP